MANMTIWLAYLAALVAVIIFWFGLQRYLNQ